MLNVFNRKSKSYSAIEHLFDKNPDIVKSTPILDNGVKDFKAKLRAIEGYHVPAVSNTVPVTTDKIRLMLEVQQNAEVERNAILLYAVENKLPELEGKMPRLYSALLQGTAEERYKRYAAIHIEAKSLGDALVPFGCDATVRNDLDTKLPLLRSALSSSQDAIDDRLDLQTGFSKLYSEMDDFLKSRLDLAVKTRLRDYPDFVDAYLQAKVLPKAVVRKKKETAVPKQEAKSVKTQETTSRETAATKEAVNEGTPTTPEPAPVSANREANAPSSDKLREAVQNMELVENGQEV